MQWRLALLGALLLCSCRDRDWQPSAVPSARPAGPSQTKPKAAALVDVVSNPAAFDKQLVKVKGLVTIRSPETFCVCPDEPARGHYGCLGLILPSDVSNWGEFNGRRCAVVGRVAAGKHGMVADAAELSVVRIDEVSGK